MEEYISKIIDLRHELHAHPELSGKETETKKRLMDFIQTETDLEVSDRGKWFFACYRCGKENAEKVAFRADFDALPIQEKNTMPYCSQNPGVSHKCGHDGHSAALAGAALKLAQDGGDKDVYLIFQHAEEVGAGGEECAGLIREKGISQVYAFHNMSGYPRGSVILQNGTAQCASKGLTIKFQGATAHASQPEDGKNPSKAIAEMVFAIEEISHREETDPLILATIVQLNAGSKNFGIAAAQGEISVTLRAQYEGDMMQMEQKIKARAEELAERDGLTVSYEESDIFPETANHAFGVEKVRRAAKSLNLKVIEETEPFRASEDFGYYLKQCPGAMFYLGNGEDHPQIHVDTYDFPDEILETAVDLFIELLK